MIRTVFYFLVTILILTLVRSMIGVIMRGFSDLVNPGQSNASAAQGRQQAPRQAANPAGGELKRDPVCGTYVPAAGSVQKTVSGKLVYFCSPECRDRYAG